MLKYLTDTSPAVHLILLLGIPLLGLPVFLPGYFHIDEALALQVAQQAYEGGLLYQDAWWSGPPLQIWVYEGFVSLFGKYATIGLRIFALLWVYIMAIYLNGMTGKVKLFKRNAGIIGILFAIAICLPWAELFLSAEMMAGLFLLMAFNRLMELKEQAQRNYLLMLEIGIFMSLSALFTYKSLFLLLGIFLAYFILRSPRLDELFALFGGLAIPLFFLGIILFIQGNGQAFWEIGILYYFERLGLTGELYYQPTTFTTLPFMLMCWAVFLILTLFGFCHFRIRFFSYVVNIRSLETVMALWLMAGLLLLVLKLRRIEAQDFQLFLPPVAFYSARIWDMRLPLRLRQLLYVIVIPLWGWIYLSGWKQAYPQTFAWLPGESTQSWLYGSMATYELPPEGLEVALTNLNPYENIWIWDHTPHWYSTLGQASRLPYTDFRMSYYKFPIFAPPTRGNRHNSRGRIRILFPYGRSRTRNNPGPSRIIWAV